MKKLLLQILFFAFTINVYAAPISQNEATKVAKVFLTNNSSTFSANSSQLDLMTISSLSVSSTIPQYYLFNSDKSFIIISGDDAATPILAYSIEEALQPNNLPDGFIKWMDKLKQEINYIRTNKLDATTEIKNEWDELNNNAYKHTQTNAVNPLIATKWSQSPYVNASCPYDVSAGSQNGYHCVTGCPATAMAQIMKFWNYPTTGSGSHSYNHSTYGTLSANFGGTTYQWSSMPNTVNGANNAVATLMYHCGVAVNMEYGPTSSGAYVIINSPTPNACSEYAYKTYFGYDAASVKGKERVNYTDANWISLLKNELDAGRPIQYAGFGGGSGHTFVCDGYDNNNFFHMNWGWGGYADGYFSINALNPGGGGTGSGTGTYNSGQQAVIGIKPPSGGGSMDDMRLYSSVTVNPNPIKYNTGFTVTVNVANFGTTSTNNFSGDYCAAIFNSNNQFVSFIEIKTGYTLNFNSHYINPLVFTTSSISALTPGNYSIGIYYKRTSATQWSAFSNGSYQNFIPIQVEGNSLNSLKLYAAITSNPTVIVQNQTFTVNFDIANFATSTFTGDISVDIHKSDGTWIRELSIKTGLSLPSNTHFTNGLTYTITGGVSDLPGTYQLFVWDRPNGGSWEFLGNGTFYNPITIQIVAPGLSPDAYEVNNTQTQAAKLNLTFSSNSGIIKTSNANIHVGTDIDYYYIDLPPNFNYTLNPRIHDSYNAGDGNTYTCDATFAYSKDGVNYGESIDDIMTGNITVNNGGRVYFIVSPYFIGKTGTYALEVKATRVATSGINSSSISELKCYPNPAIDILNIEIGEASILHYIITDVSGKTITEFNNNRSKLFIDIKEYNQGMYFINATNGEKTYSAKFVVLR